VDRVHQHEQWQTKKVETMNSKLTEKYPHTNRCFTNMSLFYLHESKKRDY
jgi:hypothetical protein